MAPSLEHVDVTEALEDPGDRGQHMAHGVAALERPERDGAVQDDAVGEGRVEPGDVVRLGGGPEGLGCAHGDNNPS